MANRRRDPLPHLKIAPNLAMQQPVGGPGQALYSPALPTSLQQSFHPSFPMNNPLQTPMQSFFVNTPGAPGRPTHAHHASIQLAAAGIHPPSNFMTPVATHFPRPSMMLAPGSQPQGPSNPFPNRNRRQLSIGGPPKAVLGGPARKVSPLPGLAAPSPAPAPSATPVKTKKIIVNLPKETVVEEDGETKTRPSWARVPLDENFVYKDTAVEPVELTTAESFPPDSWRLGLPETIDVYLPGKRAWNDVKQRNIEERLEKLGVVSGSGSNVNLPQIHAPHNRAASISSPADPALLLFKLNKLQQAQEGSSAGNSLSVSPQPPFVNPFGLSPSPNQMRLITNRHGHSMSLAQPASYQSSLFSSAPSPFNPSPFNPFGHSVLAPESVAESTASDGSSGPNDGIIAPQGRVPLSMSNFAPPPLSAVGGQSHIDFIRGFGLDAPLESEEEEEEARNNDNEEADDEDEADNARDETEEKGSVADYDDGETTGPQSRLHSRHVSRLSAALSLRSVGGNFGAQFRNDVEVEQRLESEDGNDGSDEAEKENEPPRDMPAVVDPAVEEWTGSEDLYLGQDESDDESIGEWSNPSDEERARQQRVERRMRRRNAHLVDQPRRLPNFPQPPENPPITFRSHSHANDDIISNPSEEENYVQGRRAEFVGMSTEEYHPESLHGQRTSLGAMPLHSRGPSGQYSAHDPAMAHSRAPSDSVEFPQPTYHHQANPSAGRRDSLNPLAKPFVFGAPRDRGDSGSWHGGHSANSSMPSASLTTHSRLPSIGKPLNVAAPEFKPVLNVAAPEFKPSGFNFRLPGAPQMPVPEPSIPLPLPQPVPLETIPSVESTPYKVQGREKRPRLGSSDSMDEGDSMASFKFPLPMKSESAPPENIGGKHQSALSGSSEARLNPAAEPFTFAGFSEVANNMPRMSASSEQEDAEPSEQGAEDNVHDASTAKADDSRPLSGEDEEQEIEIPAIPAKQKRAPIPLDFKHPISSGNTVPAGLFKALINSSDDRTRRAVRSRLSSHDYFEHSRRPSMDDEHVATIAHKHPRHRLVTDPGERPSPSPDDVFSSVRHVRRRSSLPDDRKLKASPSEISASPRDLTTRMELHHIEDTIGELLDDKFAELKRHIARTIPKNEQGVSSSTESMMADVISLFRTQLQESATRSLEDSQFDARGELDFQMVKDVIEDSQRELIAALQREIQALSVSGVSNAASGTAESIVPVVEQVGVKTINAVVEAISNLSARQEAMARNAPAHEQDVMVEKVVNALSPLIDSVQSDPIDYDFLTNQLAQAVKPHITQLIDLASDKRETAGLIVDKILPAIKNITIDADAITMNLVTEVRRAIAPIDAFEIKEQVADLVVERLDSRLAVRDKAFNVDTVTSKVTESVSSLLDSLNSVPSALESMSTMQNSISEKQLDLSKSQQRILSSIGEVPSQVNAHLESIKDIQKDIIQKLEQPLVSAAEPNGNVLEIKNIAESLLQDQKKLAEQIDAILSHNKAVVEKVELLPTNFSQVASDLKTTLTDLVASQDKSKKELEDLRKLNVEYQVQLTKARGSYGQARVEKDHLSEKLAAVESERDKLRAQAQESQATASAKEKEASVLVSRNAELEEALAKALARLQSSDVTAETTQQSISALEKANKDLMSEKQDLKSKVDALEMEVDFAHREKGSISKSYELLQSQHEQLSSQQNNWDTLRSATEKINLVFNLLENADSEEQKELRHFRDRSQALEEDNVSLQKRVQDLEGMLGNSDRSAATTRQTLAQAQQRSAEWERRAKESEAQLEMVQTKFEQGEQTHSQLEADYQLAKMQLEEREAANRMQEDRENKLREQISALESKCSLLQKELEKVNAARIAAKSPAPFRQTTNGNVVHPSPRPDSRASTVYDPREAATRRMSSYSSARSTTSPNLTPETSVYDSMHAPSNAKSQNQNNWSSPAMHTPTARHATLAPYTPKIHRPAYNHQYARARAPSPTPSVVSVTPTQGDDGWWS
ncbi:hypothetical protein CPC08DRAFT_665707 [Agrocybe pediades]|nr:hypothetical protein CPC08DRAFT_665707 [Agrocybe pediades]